MRKVRRWVSCSRCGADSLTGWCPVGAYTSAVTGNQFKRTCTNCGAVEMRAARADEAWAAADTEGTKSS